MSDPIDSLGAKLVSVEIAVAVSSVSVSPITISVELGCWPEPDPDPVDDELVLESSESASPAALSMV